MKRFSTLILLAAIVQPAFADEVATKHVHLSWEQRFTVANTAHDGHLTLDQAKTGYKTVARHFQEIDTNGKGFVTENDIRAWHALQKAARHSQGAEDPLRPRPAFDRFPPDQQQRGTPGPHQTMLTPEATQVPAMANLERPVQDR